MNATLITACQMFLVPSTIMFAALAVAKTEELKTVVSFMGGAMSALWLYRVLNWDTPLSQIDREVAYVLSGAFLVAWVGCFFVHGYWAIEERFFNKPYEPVTQ
jgi:hypothetical protein